MKKYLILSAATLLILASTPLFAATPHYTIIVDAGSTGSRLHLFQYENGDNAPLIKDIFSESTKPGLSSFANDPSAAAETLKKPLDDVTQALLNNHIDPHQVSISIFGTAGMRLLTPDIQQAIYDQVTNYLQNNYTLKVGAIKTIPGTLEGLYGWLDVNYLLNNFDSDTDTTQGSIDMGGASTQIAFATLDTSPSTDKITVKIAGKTYTVFSKSFFGLGLDEARKALDSRLSASCYPTNYAYSQTDKGNFNFTACGSLYHDLINAHHVSEQLPPLTNHHFIAYSGAYFTDNFFGVDKTPDQTLLETRVQTVCSESWEQLQKAYPTTPEKYLSLYCSSGVYIDQLLYGAYQLQGAQLTVTSQINQQDIDWTLGTLLYGLQ